MKEKDFIKLKVVCAKKFDFKLKAKRQITTRFWPKIYYKIVLNHSIFAVPKTRTYNIKT